MGILDQPKMTLEEFKHRVEPFTNAFPHTGMAAWADEILNRLDCCRTEQRVNPDWWNDASLGLSREATQLGAYLIWGSQYRDDYKLDIDLSEMPELYRDPLRKMVEQMVWIMTAGVEKKYKIWLTLERPDWMPGEIVGKVGEFEGERDAGATPERLGRILAKIASAALALYAPYCYYSGLPEWYEDGRLLDGAAEVLDEWRPEDV